MASAALSDQAYPDCSAPSHCLPGASPPHIAATPAAAVDSATPTVPSRRSDPSAICARFSRKERRRAAKRARRQQQRRERAIAAAEVLAREEEDRERRAEAGSAERWARIEEERRRREVEDEERRAREEGERRWLAREREIEEEKRRAEERRTWKEEAAAAAAAAVAGATAAGREDKRAGSQQTNEEDEKEEEEEEQEEVEVEVGGVPDIVWEGDDIIVRKRRVKMRRRKGECLPGEVPGTAVPVRVRVAAAVPAGEASADGGSGAEGGSRETRTAGDAGTEEKVDVRCSWVLGQLVRVSVHMCSSFYLPLHSSPVTPCFLSFIISQPPFPPLARCPHSSVCLAAAITVRASGALSISAHQPQSHLLTYHNACSAGAPDPEAGESDSAAAAGRSSMCLCSSPITHAPTSLCTSRTSTRLPTPPSPVRTTAPHACQSSSPIFLPPPCPFFLKTGACRYGLSCTRLHSYPHPHLTHTLLLPNLYQGPGLPPLTSSSCASAAAASEVGAIHCLQATPRTLPPLSTYPSSQQADSPSRACHARGVNYYLDQEWDTTQAMVQRGAKEGAVQGEKQEVGWGWAGGDGGESYECFYTDLHTEFQKYGEIYNFKASALPLLLFHSCCSAPAVCRNAAAHLRGSVYVDYLHPTHAAAALAAMAGRFYGRHQLACVLVPIDRWRNAICGEYRRKGKHHPCMPTCLFPHPLPAPSTPNHASLSSGSFSPPALPLTPIQRCPRGPSCPFLHPFANPHGDYEWADFDAPPPLLWQQQMQGLYGGGWGARDYEREFEARRERSEGGRERSAGEGKEMGAKEEEGVRELAEGVGRGGDDSGGEVKAIVGELGTRKGRKREGATQKGEGAEGEGESGVGKRGQGGGAEEEGRSRADEGRSAVEGRGRGRRGWEGRDGRSNESRSDRGEGEERGDREDRGEREEREERRKKGKRKEIGEREGQEKRRERRGKSVERGREERACGLRGDGSDGGGSDGRDESGRRGRLSDGEGERWGIQGEGGEGRRKRVDREVEGQRLWKGGKEVDWRHGEEGRESHAWERRAGGRVRRAGVRGGEEARRPDVGRGSAGGMHREERSPCAGKVNERAVLHVDSREGWRATDGRGQAWESWSGGESGKNERAERRICGDVGNNGEWGGAEEVEQGKGEKARGGRQGEGRGVEAEREKELRALLLQRMHGVGGRAAEGRDKKRDARVEGMQVQERAKGPVEDAICLGKRTIAKGGSDQGLFAASSCFPASVCEEKVVDDDRWEMET
ncbi:unnamed protein product [Closterium sp. Naga37s-1]|nr:unnamed protein product [Closterium sp. Naga37s-1]